MKNFLFKFSLRTKLILYFTGISSVLVLLTGMITYTICAHKIIETVSDSTTISIRSVCDSANALLDEAYQFCDMLQNDITLQNKMRHSFDSIQEIYSEDLTGSMDLMFISEYNQNIYGVYLLGDNGVKYKSNYASFRVSDLRNTPWYQQIHESNKPVWFAPHPDSFVVKNPHTNFISVGVPFIDKATGARVGVLLVDIEITKLSEMANRELTDYGYIFILDPARHIIPLSTKRESNTIPSAVLPQNLMPTGHLNTPIIKTADHIIVHQNLGATDCQIVGVVNIQDITATLRLLATVVVAILLCAILISYILAVRTANSVVSPLRQLMVLMHSLEGGDLAVEMPVTTGDEIGRLGQSFNHMVADMRRLIDTIYAEQTKLRRSELKALQAQINPHFLYNTLDSIIWSLRMNQVNEGITLLSSLTNFFKLSLSQGRDVISIEEEAKHVQYYLVILAMRYHEKLEYDISVDPAVLPYETPKLVLQPLVENAIYHGIKQQEGKGHIHVSITAEGDCILMEVVDDGSGIPADKLQELNNQLRTPSNQTVSPGYGIRNVNDRIKIYFGAAYGLQLLSIEGQGTTARIRIPKQCEEGGKKHDESNYL